MAHCQVHCIGIIIGKCELSVIDNQIGARTSSSILKEALIGVLGPFLLIRVVDRFASAYLYHYG